MRVARRAMQRRKRQGGIRHARIMPRGIAGKQAMPPASHGKRLRCFLRGGCGALRRNAQEQPAR
jgi:hypothetical protein